MVCRLSFLYAEAPGASATIAWTGAATALFAATIAIAQTDIKKVLAYSTVSQLGYMFVAAGCGAYGAAIFHVGTHAFFKALLFLGSGAVILAMHHEQDTDQMGGLRKYLPLTHGVFLVGVLAISGFPPFSGFFSKDEILLSAYTAHHIPGHSRDLGDGPRDRRRSPPSTCGGSTSAPSSASCARAPRARPRRAPDPRAALDGAGAARRARGLLLRRGLLRPAADLGRHARHSRLERARRLPARRAAAPGAFDRPRHGDRSRAARDRRGGARNPRRGLAVRLEPRRAGRDPLRRSRPCTGWSRTSTTSTRSTTP